MKIHDLRPADGSKTSKRRVGRGIGGRRGKTAGRGMKGQKARGTVPVGFEGGQLPLAQRVPKLKGFNNPFRVEYVVVNLDALESFEGDEVTPASLRSKGLVKKNGLVKILGRGQLSRPVRVKAHAFSRSAAKAIEDAGGTVEVLPLPWGERRPAFQGSAHTNR